MDKKKALGQRIKELRKLRKLSQENLAELIGLEPPSVCNIENGKNYPTIQNLEKITDVLEVSLMDIFNFEHLKSKQELIHEIVFLLDKNPDKLKDIYKIVKAIAN